MLLSWLMVFLWLDFVVTPKTPRTYSWLCALRSLEAGLDNCTECSTTPLTPKQCYYSIYIHLILQNLESPYTKTFFFVLGPNSWCSGITPIIVFSKYSWLAREEHTGCHGLNLGWCMKAAPSYCTTALISILSTFDINS